MKKIVIIFTLVIGFLASSCSKDNDVVSEPGSIVGRWVLEKMQEVSSKETIPYTDGIEYTFKADGTFTGFTNEYEIEGEDAVTKKVAVSGTYKLSDNGDKITILEKGEEPEVFDIYSLTAKKMVLRSKFEDLIIEATFNKK